MGNASCQLSERFHFLGLAKLVLELASGGNVLRCANHSDGVSRVVLDGKQSVAQPAHLAIGFADSKYLVIGVALQRPLKCGHDGFPIFRVDRLGQCAPASAELVRRSAKNLIACGLTYEMVSFGISRT